MEAGCMRLIAVMANKLTNNEEMAMKLPDGAPPKTAVLLPPTSIDGRYNESNATDASIDNSSGLGRRLCVGDGGVVDDKPIDPAGEGAT